MKTRIVLSLALIATCFKAFAAPVGKSVVQKTDRIIVRYHAQPTEGNAMTYIKQGVTYGGFGVAAGKRKDVFDIGAILHVDDVKTLADGLEYDPQVAYAEPDYIMQKMLVPNDSRYNEQWHYFETTGGINLPAAWDITTGSTSVVVAVIDTGVRNHPDISSKLVPGYDFITNATNAHDGSGRDSNPVDPGDAVSRGECTYPGGPVRPQQSSNSSWHGTHVAGTIAAKSNNGTGVTGISWGSKILPVRVLGICGGYMSDIADAIRWSAGLNVSSVPANTNPAKVINLSLGGSDSCAQTYQDAINEVTNAGVTVIVAAGNSAQNSASTQPGNCNNVISVAATDRQGDLSYYSNYGSLIDIAAPGGEIFITSATDPTLIDGSGVLSLSNSGTDDPSTSIYKYHQGTSMAAPHVAGVVALMYSLRPNITPARVEQLIKEHARSFPWGSSCGASNCGSGILDAASVLQAVQNEPL